MFDPELFGGEVVAAVRSYVERATAPMLGQIETLERRLADLESGPVYSAEQVEKMIADALKAIPASGPAPDVEGMIEAAASDLRDKIAGLDERIAALPTPKDGMDGKDADPEAIAQMVADAVAAIPVPKDGRDGKDFDPEALALAVSKAVAQIPVPADGKDAVLPDIPAMVAEHVERAVAAIPVPKDGVSLAGALINRDGELVITLSDGSTRELGPVVGKDGEPGKDGKDGRNGFSLDDFDTEMKADGRTIELKFVSGDVTEIHELQFPLMIYRGVFKDGEAYERGDAVTWAGSLWHCNEPTSTKPGEGSLWTLTAKKGRDGRDGVVKEPAKK